MDPTITYKSMKKHTWSPLAPPRLTLASPGASGGTPPDENVSKNTQKNVFRSIKIRKQISVKKYSEKHLPLQNPLERGGLGGAHLDMGYNPSEGQMGSDLPDGEMGNYQKYN